MIQPAKVRLTRFRLMKGHFPLTMQDERGAMSHLPCHPLLFILVQRSYQGRPGGVAIP
jgi:hypothetical protein